MSYGNEFMQDEWDRDLIDTIEEDLDRDLIDIIEEDPEWISEYNAVFLSMCDNIDVPDESELPF